LSARAAPDWPVTEAGISVPLAGRDAGPDGILPVYEAVGAGWAARRSQSLFERPALDRFVAALPGPRVLDVGCGSGVPLARHLASCGLAVTGVDGAGVMVALFRRNLPGAAVVHADMRTMALGERFDGLLAWDSLFHLSPADQRKALLVLGAHAAPGAVLMFTSGPAAGEAVGVVEGRPVYHASLSPEGYREALARAGFAVIDLRLHDAEVDGRTIWLARHVGTDAAPA
jgi:SAM-dependent methyltransferase